MTPFFDTVDRAIQALAFRKADLKEYARRARWLGRDEIAAQRERDILDQDQIVAAFFATMAERSSVLRTFSEEFHHLMAEGMKPEDAALIAMEELS